MVKTIKGALPELRGSSRPSTTLDPRDLDALFWPLQTPGTHGMHGPYAGKIHTNQIKFKKLKFFLNVLECYVPHRWSQLE